MHADPKDWLLGILGQVSRASRPGSTVDTVMADIAAGPGLPGNGGSGARPTPEQLAFLQRLVVHLLEGRSLIKTYNIVLLAVLAIFSACHFATVFRDHRKQAVLESRQCTEARSRDASSPSPSSSSSSTLDGSSSPPGSIQKPSQDIERQPLLGQRPTAQPSRRRLLPRLRGWLMYQPGCIPIINRALPSNGTTLLVLAYLGLNIFYQCYHSTWDPELLFVVGDRAGLVFVANLPLLYLLAAKNQPVQRLTGYSYESLNILHRRVGEVLCFEALVHGGCIIIWVLSTAPGWLQQVFSNFFQARIVILGLIALGAYELLYFTSLGSFRQRWYELFLVSHVILQVVALAVLWFHQSNTRPYVGAALAIFVLDRLVWRLFLKSATLKADLTVLEDGETVLVSADWDILYPPAPGSHARSWTRKLCQNNILRGWQPADHVFVSIPKLGRTHALQAHPFTIASAAPSAPPLPTSMSPGSDQRPPSTTHAWLNLLIRAHTGFSRDLLYHAHLHKTVNVRLDGPYGSQEVLHMLRACRSNVLVAGGSGIAVILPLAWSLAVSTASDGKKQRRRIHLIWIIHSASQRSWVPQDRLDELKQLGVELVLPEPTVAAGRPDVPRYIDELTAPSDLWGAGAEDIGVVVSGPDGLNRSVRNACSAAVRDGRKVRLSVEKFGW